MLLLIGPRRNYKNPSMTGGIIVAFEDLLNWCEQNNIQYVIVDTNKNNYKNKLHAYFAILKSVIKEIKKVAFVSLHGTYNDYLFIAPYVVLFSKLLGKKVSLRKFAGNFDKLYSNSNLIFQIILRKTLRHSNILFFETLHLVNFGKTINRNTFWFPNGRQDKSDMTNGHAFRKKFVFISQVKDSKGVREICDAFKKLPQEYTFDLFGPIVPSELHLEERKEVFDKIYKGALQSDKVIDVLKAYDVVVLPTYHQGEGYPGILIEAYSLNKPVITTYWNSIPEIVDNMKTGILIRPKNANELLNAIIHFNETNYQIYQQNIEEYFKQFDRNFIYNNFMKTLLK